MELFGNTFQTKDGEADDSTLKSAQLIGIYFSAHWCPPCRGFTPVLANFYNEINKNEKIFEIVFSSCDNSEEQYRDYLSKMPWIALSLNHPLSETL
jgi:nucleoredoxin